MLHSYAHVNRELCRRLVERGHDLSLPIAGSGAQESATLAVPTALSARFGRPLRRAAEVVVPCKSGARSARAVGLLREAGFANVTNLSGGILSWIKEIDGSLARY